MNNPYGKHTKELYTINMQTYNFLYMRNNYFLIIQTACKKNTYTKILIYLLVNLIYNTFNTYKKLSNVFRKKFIHENNVNAINYMTN